MTIKGVRCYKAEDLPDGEYNGIMSGFTVYISHIGYVYRLECDKAVKGVNVPAKVIFYDGEILVEVI